MANNVHRARLARLQNRGGGPDAAGYRLLAVGLALLGLGGWRRRIRVVTAQDVPDIHADLVVGFFTRLSTIDTRRANIAGRLIDSAIGYAALCYPGRAEAEAAARAAQPWRTV